MEDKLQVVTIRAKTVETEESSFKAYKVNVDGRAVDLRFTKNSDMDELKKLEDKADGVYSVGVSELSESKTSFYPRYYAALVEVLDDGWGD